MKNTIYLAKGWLLEILTILLVPLSVFLIPLKYIFNFDGLNRNPTQNTSIIIFENWINKNLWHIFMKRYLENKGFKVYWTNYSFLKGDISQAAEGLKDYIEKNDINEALLVGVSMGGVSGLYYLNNYQGWKRIKRFVTLASPLQGTDAAKFLKFFKIGRQIIFHASFLKKFILSPLKSKNKVICVAAKHDELVPLPQSLLPGTRHKIINAVGHNMLHIFTKEVFEIIAQEAKAA